MRTQRRERERERERESNQCRRKVGGDRGVVEVGEEKRERVPPERRIDGLRVRVGHGNGERELRREENCYEF